MSKKPIADLLSEHLNTQLQLDLPDRYFHPYLEAGQCIVLFDGLDEVANKKKRREVAKAVALFANLYRENRYVITSRIAGDREIQQLPKSDFAHFTIRYFDDNQIKEFTQNWYQAKYPLEADKRADDLIQAIERNPRVKQLAKNPLMLTIIAIIHRSRANLPNERIRLYDQCTKVLLFSWQREHGRPRLTDIRGNSILDTEALRRLERLAYWMHSEAPAAQEQMHVKYKCIKSKLAEQLADRKKVEPDEAEDEAKHFLEYIRKTTGVLLERGTELYGFVHPTFQEYFAACDIYRRCRGNVEKVWEEISPYLHDSHWREVIRLLVARLSSEFDDIGEELIQKILNAETPYDDLLPRNLFLAASCLADNVTAEVETYKRIIEETVDIAIRSPFRLRYGVRIGFSYGVRWEYEGILEDLANSRYKKDFMDKLLELLSDEDPSVRERTLRILWEISEIGDRVVDARGKLLCDEDSSVRERRVDAPWIDKLDELVEKLVELLSDDFVHNWAEYVLEGIGKADERVVEKLLGLLSNENPSVHAFATYSLVKIGILNEIVLDSLKSICEDYKKCNALVPDSGDGTIWICDWAFWTLWRHDPNRIREIASELD